MNAPFKHPNLLMVIALVLLVSDSYAEARPLVFGHRGASGYRPEHTQPAYELAMLQGADGIEPDLVFSKDGVLVVRHENDISETTDVEVKFPERRTTKVIDGETREGWFTEDFTWPELQTLRARERLPDRNHAFDDQFSLLKFSDVVALAKAANRSVLVLPELKHPTYFRSLGFDPEMALVKELEAAGWNHADAPVVVQSFEPTSLMRLREFSRVQAALLIDIDGQPYDFKVANDPRTYHDLIAPNELEKIRAYAEWVAPHKGLIYSCWILGLFVKGPTSLVDDAHAAGLKVVTWTLRKEARFIPVCRFGDFVGEINDLKKTGVDAIFTDYPDIVLGVL